MFLELLIIAIGTSIAYFTWRAQTYWQRKNVPVPPFYPVIGHSLDTLFIKSQRWKAVDKVYKENYDKPFWGMYEFFSPQLFVKDLEVIKKVLITDADYFVDRRHFKFSSEDVLFNEMLSLATGDKWKNLRTIMSPTFSSGRIKGMFTITLPIADKLVNYFTKETTEKGQADVIECYGKYNTNVVASCIFGLELDCFKETTEFEKCAKSMTATPPVMMIKIAICNFLPQWLIDLSGMKFTSPEMHILSDIVRKTIDARKESETVRGDFIDIIMEAYRESKESDDSKYKMTMDTVVSQCLLFVFAGFDTTGSSLSIITHYLAKHPDCQEKIRNELNKLQSDGQLDYNTVMTAPFLDACIYEALRLNSPAHVLERQCTKDYNLSNTNLTIEKGTLVSIPTWSISHDQEHFDDPDDFKPERFLPENKENMKNCTIYMFGQGPRNCIGMRFATMVLKTALAKLLKFKKIRLAPGYEELPLDGSTGTMKIGKPGIKIICEDL